MALLHLMNIVLAMSFPVNAFVKWYQVDHVFDVGPDGMAIQLSRGPDALVHRILFHTPNKMVEVSIEHTMIDDSNDCIERTGFTLHHDLQTSVCEEFDHVAFYKGDFLNFVDPKVIGEHACAGSKLVLRTNKSGNAVLDICRESTIITKHLTVFVKYVPSTHDSAEHAVDQQFEIVQRVQADPAYGRREIFHATKGQVVEVQFKEFIAPFQGAVPNELLEIHKRVECTSYVFMHFNRSVPYCHGGLNPELSSPPVQRLCDGDVQRHPSNALFKADRTGPVYLDFCILRMNYLIFFSQDPKIREEAIDFKLKTPTKFAATVTLKSAPECGSNDAPFGVCDSKRRNGFCTSQKSDERDYMKKNCKKVCGLCAEECANMPRFDRNCMENKAKWCPSPIMAKVVCPMTCGTCHTAPPS